MRKIAALVDHELTWTQCSTFKSEFELRFGGDIVGTLRFPKMMSTRAEAESGDGSWTFERVGFWKMRIIVRASGSTSELGSYRSNAWKGGGVLELSDGRKFNVTRSVWKSTLEFQTEAGEPLVHIKNKGVFRISASVRMNRKVLQVPEFPWLVLLGLYLTIMARNDAATHAATG